MDEDCQDFLADLMARFGFQTLHEVRRCSYRFMEVIKGYCRRCYTRDRLAQVKRESLVLSRGTLCEAKQAEQVD